MAAIDSYKDAYGFYPPDNGQTAANLSSARVNQLYYELEGTTKNDPVFTTLDGASSITTNDVPKLFNVGGFVNCNKPGSGEDAQKARNFIHELKPGQTGSVSNSVTHPSNFGTILCASFGGPDSLYQPLGAFGLNPWRYKSSGTLTNNPGSYELWIQLVINGQTNLVCNWTKQVQVGNPLP
jgi:hypothetical protein